MARLILASTSPYRRQLLQRLQTPFETAAPRTDEAAVPGEPPDARALRLAEEKAQAVAATHADALILGGDQTIADGADGNRIFDKPGSADKAIAQLLAMRGRHLVFFTAVALAANGGVQSRLVVHRARFRHASQEEITRYVAKEAALDCAGGAQIEGLGITLLGAICGGDPTALLGMPLMAVGELLRAHGIAAP